MKLIINKKDLLRIASAASRAIDRKTSMPILQALLFRAEADGTLTAYGMGTQMSASASCKASEVTEAGAVCVDAGRLLRVLKGLGEYPVAWSVDAEQGGGDMQGGVLRLASGKTEVDLWTFEATRSPGRREFGKADEAFCLPVAVTRELLGKTLPFTAEGVERAAFSGVHFTFLASAVEAAATNGHGVCVVRRTCEHGLAVGRTALIHGEPLAAVLACLDEAADTDTVSVELGASGQRFTVGDVSLECARLEGSFPKYEMIIPKDNNKFALVNRFALQQAIGRAGEFAQVEGEKKGAFKRAVFEFGKAGLKIAAHGLNTGRIRDEVTLESYEGDPLSIMLNLPQLVDVLKTLECDVVKLSMKKDVSFVLFEDPADDGVRVVVAPMKA